MGVVVIYDHGAFILPNFVIPVLIAVAVCWWRWRRTR